MEMTSLGLLVFCFLAVFGCASHERENEKPENEEANREQIRAVVGPHLKEARLCYEEALDETPMLEGKLVLSWDLDPTGHPVHILVKEASSKIQLVAPCLMAKVKTWRFPPPGSANSVNVIYPFYFSENGTFKGERDQGGGTTNTAPAPGAESGLHAAKKTKASDSEPESIPAPKLEPKKDLPGLLPEEPPDKDSLGEPFLEK